MLHLPATVQVGPPLKWEVEHAILGSVIFHPTWAVAGRWSTRMGGGWSIYDAKSLIFYALNILLGVKAVVAKLDVALVMTLLAKFRN